MTIDEAAAIVDQLSTCVASGEDSDVPPAKSMFKAIRTFNAKLKQLGIEKMPLPLGMKFNSYSINEETALAAKAIKNQTNAAIASAAADAAVDEVLGKAPPSRKKRL